ncbi:Trs120-domain-containing protein [Tothia fuscella]|uniref:Trs120-domain-containing protein n=1 Tax=Tothia fuscella TaxID=1048955 RepID=A0A9P4NVL4_9PEZI|nr:Trs120-domain-containing protein [Tothia fuscella]
MPMDSFSPTAPARVRALALPVGRIKKARFHSFIGLLESRSEIRLGDVSPDSRPNRNMFSPLAFPGGVVLYDFSTSVPTAAHLALSPFEMFREPLVILGIADSTEADLPSDEDEARDAQAEMLVALRDFKEDYPRALVHKVFIFDSPLMSAPILNHDILPIPPAKDMKTTTMRTVICDVTSIFLAELTTLAISIKGLPSIPSPSVPQMAPNGLASSQFYQDDPPALGQTTSQPGENLRSSSLAHNNFHRMSMPVFSSSAPNLDGLGSQVSAETVPAKTFDEIATSEPGIVGVGGGGSRPLSTNSSREASRDRVSVHGFGPGSINERNRNKGKCRVALVVGALYLQSGRWHDALRELAEGAALARSFGDHLWHAKALENLVICMILLAWSGSEFKIPQVCYPNSDKSSSSKPVSKDANTTSNIQSNGTSNANQAALRQDLADALPDLVNMVLTIYNRASNSTSDAIPQLAFSECVVRLAKVLTSINLAGGALTHAAFQAIIRGDYISLRSSSVMTTRLTINPSRAAITDILLRAMPGSIEYSGLSAVDQMLILGGIASVFSILGLQRKKAIIIKEYLDTLIQALTQAKKAGAAEAGFHPSTKLASINGSALSGLEDAPEGLEDFLSLLCQVYGIPESNWVQSIGSETLQTEAVANGEAPAKNLGRQSMLPEQLVGNFVLRFFGSVNVKSDVLRTCIQLCEALSDLHGVLHYTSALLRTAGPGIAPSTDTSDVLVTLAREEQVVLSNNVAKAVVEATALGLHGIEAEYWDEFLVRGVYLVAPPPALVLHPHRRSDLGVARKEIKGPFLHNPFLEKRESKVVDNLLAVDDEREFVVSLQNPYDFEVHIESLRLVSDGKEFASALNHILRPYRTQSFSVMGSLNSTGTLNLNGCTIKIRGCRERLFPIFKEPWAPQQEVKIKNIGLMKRHIPNSRPVPAESTSSLDKQASAHAFPTPASVTLTVIPEQPILTVSSVSLSQSALMLLEGESSRFTVSVWNTSKKVQADFVHVSFRDSTTTAIQEALGNKKLSPAELFELEHQLAYNPAIRICGDPPTQIGSGETKDFEFEVHGKPGLTTAVVHIDYATLSTPHLKSDENFYTRQVTVPITVTVNASIQLQKLEIMPISSNHIWRHNISGNDRLQKQVVINGSQGNEYSEHESCLLLLDLRNAWPTPLEITLRITNGDTSQEVIQPGHVSRMIVLLPKIYIENPHARIRSANERQFVVSAANLSPESERLNREIFWYREELLKLLQASWRQEDDGRSGSIDLRSMIRLNSRMVGTLKLGDVAFEMTVLGSDAAEVQQTARSTFTIQVDDYLTLRIRVTNRSQTTIYPLLRLGPALAHQPQDIALELGKRFVWSGSLQQVLKPLEPGGVVETNLAICALCSGEYELGATVEEIKVCKRDEQEKEVSGGIPDPVASSLGRRTWIASEPCRIRAVED